MQHIMPVPEAKTIVVTGANSGIGKEIARQLAEDSHQLVLASRNVDRSNTVRDELLAESGRRNGNPAEISVDSR